jgi:hypothetical protein
MSERIFIPATTLADFLANAEKAESVIKDDTREIQVLRKTLRKRMRQSTPMEELDEGKEKRFKTPEERVGEAVMKADKAWSGESED